MDHTDNDWLAKQAMLWRARVFQTAIAIDHLNILELEPEHQRYVGNTGLILMHKWKAAKLVMETEVQNNPPRIPLEAVPECNCVAMN